MKKRILFSLAFFVAGFLGDLTQQCIFTLRESPDITFSITSGAFFGIIAFMAYDHIKKN